MWGFNGREAYDRRVYFWNLISAVQWQVNLLRLLFVTEPNLTMFLMVESGDRKTTKFVNYLY